MVEQRDQTLAYTCLQHQTVDIAANKSGCEMRIKVEVENLCRNLEYLRNFQPPSTLNCTFNEKVIKYELTL